MVSSVILGRRWAQDFRLGQSHATVVETSTLQSIVSGHSVLFLIFYPVYHCHARASTSNFPRVHHHRTAMTTPTNIDPKDIQAYWAKYQGDKYVEGWASLWDKGDNLPWDR